MKRRHPVRRSAPRRPVGYGVYILNQRGQWQLISAHGTKASADRVAGQLRARISHAIPASGYAPKKTRKFGVRR